MNEIPKDKSLRKRNRKRMDIKNIISTTHVSTHPPSGLITRKKNPERGEWCVNVTERVVDVS